MYEVVYRIFRYSLPMDLAWSLADRRLSHKETSCVLEQPRSSAKELKVGHCPDLSKANQTAHDGA
jgi:hypothetical protein